MSAEEICRYINKYITQQNKSHKTIGTMAMDMCLKYKGDIKECTKYPALHKLKM